jgi:hypothetical protein
MKHSLTGILLILLCTSLHAQRDYLPTPGDLDRFHGSKTYVVLNSNPLSDYNLEIRDAVERYWTITPHEFIDYKDFEQKSLDPGASFLYLAAVSFEKDKSRTRYMFLCLSLGGERETLNDLKDITNLPLGYHGVDEDSYAYKLGTIIRFMQEHIRLITEKPELVSQNVFQYYNDNMADVREKTLYLVEDELPLELSSEAKIREVYPYQVKIVDRDEIKDLIMAGDPDAVFLHKVGPEGKNLEARVYKILIGASDARFYYYDYHKVTDKNPDAFLKNDFERLTRASQE